MPDLIGYPLEPGKQTKFYVLFDMKKFIYTAPEAEWLEAVNANCFLADSETGDIPELTDGGWTEIW